MGGSAPASVFLLHTATNSHKQHDDQRNMMMRTVDDEKISSIRHLSLLTVDLKVNTPKSHWEVQKSSSSIHDSDSWKLDGSSASISTDCLNRSNLENSTPSMLANARSAFSSSQHDSAFSMSESDFSCRNTVGTVTSVQQKWREYRAEEQNHDLGSSSPNLRTQILEQELDDIGSLLRQVRSSGPHSPMIPTKTKKLNTFARGILSKAKSDSSSLSLIRKMVAIP
jgi:hypothetical protein